MTEKTAEPAFSADAFRNAMRLLPGAVSVVTARSGDRLAGFTATSVTSFSADPPTLLVCINQTSSSWPILKEARFFAVNVLGACQDHVADRFSGRLGHTGDARYQGANWRHTESPHLVDALVTFDCSVDEIIERHTHAIVLGRIRDVVTGDPSNALLYWRGQYERIGWTSDELSNAIGLCPDTWPRVRELAHR